MEAYAETKAAGNHLTSWLKEELQPSRLVSSLVAGGVTAILTVIESVSYAALIFSGAMAAHISTGIAITLTSAAVAGIVMTIGSSYPGTIAVPQNKIAPILALVAASIIATMPDGATAEQMLMTVVAAVLVSSFAAGVFMTALGVFKLGGLIRFIPYPVIAGFLAGTGWLLLLGSIKAMTGTPVTLSTLPGLFEKALLVKWLPGLVFAVTALFFMHRIKHFLVMPTLLTTAFLIFYGVLLATGTSVHEAREAGWLIHTASDGGLFRFLTVRSVLEAEWPVIIHQAGSIASILLIAAVSVLLNSSALELASKQDLDLDRELKSAGIANIATGLAGGMIGFTSLTITGLGLKMGVKSRLVGLMTVAFCSAVLFLGAGVLSYFPEPIIGGLLMFLGIEFLIEWVIHTRHNLPLSDWLIVIMILAVVSLFGFLQGVLVGIIAAIIMFVLNYSRINVIKHELTGIHHHSNVDRPPRHKRILREKGDQILLLKLHGYIFFGTANSLLNQVRERVADTGRAPLRFALLDFRDVSGIDSSAVISLVKMNQLADKNDFKVAYTHLPEHIRKQLEQGELGDMDDGSCLDFTDLDHGLEWCEDRILAAQGESLEDGGRTLAEYLEELVPGGLDYAKFDRYLERIELPAGHPLLRQGDRSNDLYFIESGRVSVRIELEGGEILRIQKMGAGSVVGELGMYLNKARTASVVTTEPTVVYRLTSASLRKMEENNPQTASSFHRFMVRFLAQRLINTDNTLKTLLK